MPASEFAYVSGSSPMVSSSKKAPVSKPAPAKISHEHDYDSDDEIAIAKAEHMGTTPSSPKSSLLSKVKAKMSPSSKPTSSHKPAKHSTSPPSAPSSSSSSSQAKKDTLFAYKVLAETRM